MPQRFGQAHTREFRGASAEARCCNCDGPASGCHSLPVDSNGDVVATSYAGEWAGMAACEACFKIHKAAKDEAPGVLDAFESVTNDLRDELRQCRDIIHALAKAAQAGAVVVGHP